MGAVVTSSSEGGKCRVAGRLFAKGATSPWSAPAFEPKNSRDRQGLAAALASGLVVRTEDGTYYVHPERYERMRAHQRWAVVIAIAIMLIMLAILFVTGEFN